MLRELPARPHQAPGRRRTRGAVVGYLNLVPATRSHPRWPRWWCTRTRGGAASASALIRTGLAEGGAGARFWAHGNLRAARATAAALGLVVVRELLADAALAERPARGRACSDGVRLRTYAGPGDDAELLRVNNAAFAWHPEQGGWTERDIAERRAEPWFDPAGLFLALRASDDSETTRQLLGFHWTKIARAGDLGEVYVVGVDPAAQGRGLGGGADPRWACTTSRSAVGADATVMLYVEADNSAAVRTYDGWVSTSSQTRTSRTPRVSPSAVKPLSLFTSRSPFIPEPSTGGAYVAGESEAVNRKWDK